jgi:hypothetical protein
VSTPEGCEGEVTFTALRAYRGDAFGGAADWYLSVPGVIEPPPAPPA